MNTARTTYRALRALGPIDARSLGRDALLRWILLFPVLIAAMLRWLVPFLAARLQAEFGFDIRPYYPLGVSFVPAAIPMMFGLAIGFLLLDQRDDGTLVALRVSPLPLSGYLAYRIALPVSLSLLSTLLVLPFINLVELRTLPLLVTAVAAAPLAPLFALVLAAVAENKVQGFALTKAIGIILIPPLVAYFIQPPWQLLFGLAPTFWPVKVFWAFSGGDPLKWAYFLSGMAYQLGLLAFLLSRFDRIMSR